MKTTKQLLVCTLVLCCFSLQLSAQFNLGIRSGYVKAWQDYGAVPLPDDARTHIHGLHVAALAYYDISPYFRIGVEPGYTRRGAACEPGFIIFNEDTKLRMNYIEVPIMMQGRLPLFGDKFELFGKAGYGASMAMSASREIRDLLGVQPTVTIPVSLNGRSNIQRWDHGVYGGLGLGFNVGTNQLFFESSYYLGFTDVDQWNTSKNRNLRLGLGYLISL